MGASASVAAPDGNLVDLSDAEVEERVRELFKKNRERLEEVVGVVTSTLSEERTKAQSSNHMVSNMVHQEYSRKVSDVYKVSRTQLGSGISGAVIKVQHRKTGVQYAMKSLRLEKSKAAMEELRNEIAIMSELDHPNIVRLVEAFYTDTHVHLIMELCSGGELYQHLIDNRRYGERDAKQFVRKILLATAYLHKHGVVHRDLKLENILFDGAGAGSESELKVCDFGLSQHYQPGTHMTALAGTPYYIAPEVLDGDYDEKCDLWSIGVISFMLLSGTPPFPGNSNDEILSNVRSGNYSMEGSRWRPVSENAKDFIRQLLLLDPAQRPSCTEVVDHPWLVDSAEYEATHQPVLDNVVNNLKSFIKFSALKRLAMEVVAFRLHPDQVRALRTEFLKFDTEATGVISVAEFRSALAGSERLSQEDADNIFHKIDLDHSGEISWHEFLAAAIDTSTISEVHLKEAFEHLDSKHQGEITKQDIVDLMGADANESEVSAMFDEMKGRANERGSITCTDFIQLCRENSFRGNPAAHARGRLLSSPKIDPTINFESIDEEGAAL